MRHGKDYSKLVSKFYRLKMRDDIASFLQALPFKHLEETQIGNYVYSASGPMETGTSNVHVEIRIAIQHEQPELRVKVPKLGIQVQMPFEPIACAEAIRLAFLRGLN